MEQKPNTSESGAAGNASSASAAKHQLPPLPYDYAALEPHVDTRTMQIHHDKHHQTYVDKLNEAIATYAELRDRSVPWLLTHLDRVPESIRTAVRNNGGGHLNHSLFWRFMAPNGGGQPGGALARAIEQSFGGLEQFQKKFDEAGAKVFGSGWVFLAMAQGKAGGASTLEIVTTPGHDNPIQQGKYPLLLNDVWEHAYYLKHQNRRPEYLKGWWAVVNWREVERRFDSPGQPSESEPEGAFPA